MKTIEIVELLKENNSRLAKEELLVDAWNSGNRDFFTACLWCFDGLKTFGIKKMPLGNNTLTESKHSFDDFIILLNKLSKREVTGNAAIFAVEAFADGVQIKEWNLFYKNVLTKDLDCGISETTTNKIMKKIGGDALNYLVKEYPYQRCSLLKDSKISDATFKLGVLSQKKFDGMFINCSVDDTGIVDVLSRSGQPFDLTRFGILENEILLSFPKGTQTHGEMVVIQNGQELPRQIGNGMINSVKQGENFPSGATPLFKVWDQIPLSSAIPKGECKTPYSTRFSNVKNQLSQNHLTTIQIADSRVVYTMEEAMAHYHEMVLAGFEGTIIKDPNAPWKDGTSKSYVKLKVDFECDLLITGWKPGNGKNANLFGSLETQSADGLLEVNVSGYSDEYRKWIHDNMDEVIGSIMAVTSNGIMPPSGNSEKYSLFLPRCNEIRKDKTEADTLERIKEQFEEALGK